MKLLLVTVTAIAVFTADCRDFSNEPEGPGTGNDAQLFPEEIEGQDLQPNERSLLVADGSGSESSYKHNQIKERTLLGAGESTDQDFTGIDQHQKETNLIMTVSQGSFLEEENEHAQRKLRKLRRSRCKARNSCVVMGGFCVTNATLCGGRLVPEGCKGTYCQCCVPGTIEAKFDSLEEELQSLKDNMNSSISNLNSELQLIKKNMTKSNSDLNSVLQSFIVNTNNSNYNLNTELQSLKVNTNNMNSNFDSKMSSMNSSLNTKLNSISENQGCPKGFFKSPAPANQCFKYFTDRRLQWTAAKSKCASEGLVLAKPYEPLALRSYLLLRYGDVSGVWLGARGTGSSATWDRDGKTISGSNILWYSGQPGSYTSSTYCLWLMGHASYLVNYSTKPYYMTHCINSRYALCELVRE